MSIFSDIESIVKRVAREPLDNEGAVLRFLQSWWSRTYDRPLKDPLLLSYSLEELYYEFLDRRERETAATERLEEESDKIEDKKIEDAQAWAEEEEAKELAAWQAKSNKTKPEVDSKPGSWEPSPEDIEWMNKEVEQAKAEFGEGFGEDINEVFK